MPYVNTERQNPLEARTSLLFAHHDFLERIECGGLAKQMSSPDHEIMVFTSTSLRAPWLPITRAFQTSRPPPPPSERPSRKCPSFHTQTEINCCRKKKKTSTCCSKQRLAHSLHLRGNMRKPFRYQKLMSTDPVHPVKRSFQFPPLASNSTASAAESTGEYAKRAGLNHFGLME